MAREILFDLGKMITDRLPYKFGFKKLTEEDPEYIILDRACSNDEIAEVMLKMGLRKPKTTAEIAKITHKSPERIEELLTDAAMHGIVEYNWEIPAHEKQWYVQLFVPVIAEMTNMVLEQVAKADEAAFARKCQDGVGEGLWLTLTSLYSLISHNLHFMYHIR